MIQIFIADGADGTNQPKVVQEVLADQKSALFNDLSLIIPGYISSVGDGQISLVQA